MQTKTFRELKSTVKTLIEQSKKLNRYLTFIENNCNGFKEAFTRLWNICFCEKSRYFAFRKVTCDVKCFDMTSNKKQLDYTKISEKTLKASEQKQFDRNYQKNIKLKTNFSIEKED